MTRTLSLLALLLLATQAPAQDAARCESVEEHPDRTLQSFAAVDMGGGIVAQGLAQIGDAGNGLVNVHEQTRFEVCATGRAIEVWGNHVPYPDREPTEIAALIHEAIASPKPITLQELSDLIDSTMTWGSSVIEATSTESCGCALHYPGLRTAGGAP